jgi:hypothetical protein
MKKTKQATGYGLGTVIFDVRNKKRGRKTFDVTPGQYDGLELDGVAVNIRWWDFLKEEEEKRNRVPKKLEFRYDENRRRVKNEGVSDKGTKPREDPRDVPILPYPGRVPRVNRPRNVPPPKRSKLN